MFNQTPAPSVSSAHTNGNMLGVCLGWFQTEIMGCGQKGCTNKKKKKKGLKKDRISRVRDVSPLSVKVLVLDGGNGSCVTLNESEYSRDICLTPKRTITHTWMSKGVPADDMLQPNNDGHSCFPHVRVGFAQLGSDFSTAFGFLNLQTEPWGHHQLCKMSQRWPKASFGKWTASQSSKKNPQPPNH